MTAKRTVNEINQDNFQEALILIYKTTLYKHHLAKTTKLF